MAISKIYFKYSVSEYIKILAAMFLVFFCIIFLFDILELFRVGSKYSLKLSMIARLALMKNYSSLSKTMPILILISTLIYFYIKNKNNEIVAAKSFGISNMGILLPIVTSVFIFGVVNITVLNPIGTTLLQKYQNYETHKFKKHFSLVSVSKSGIWLKNKLGEDDVIINALRVSRVSNVMYDTNIFFINQNGILEKRINAAAILFQKNEIIVKDALIIDKNFKIENVKKLILPIKISLSQIFENLTSMETMSLFQLLEFIKITSDSGLSTSKYTLCLLKELLSPFFLVSMAIISYFYSCHIVRREKTDISPLFCIITGFVITFTANFIYTLGASGKISIFLAAIFPVITSNVLALYLVFHKHY
jgi:lipopolysaccharide export system permease protein